MSRTRDYRRHKLAVIKRRVRHYYRPLNAYYQYVPWDDPAVIGRFAQTRKPCSCYCCGNVRRHFGELPAQWRRAIQEPIP